MLAPWRHKAGQWLNGNPDDAVLRWLFRAVIAITVGVVALDYAELSFGTPEQVASTTATPASPVANPTPSAAPPLIRIRQRDGDTRRAPLRRPDESLRSRMTFDLQADGRLVATGTIEPGIAKVFAAEVAKRGSYIKTVVLHSPGGSVQDALAMGRLIREKKFATEVVSGRYCASSCPLVFAGGVERRAGDKAAIGVHQVSALSPIPAGADMDHAQRISAECQRYLAEMGVALQVWVHAMETPKDELFTFRSDELLTLKLATQPAASPAQANAARRS